MKVVHFASNVVRWFRENRRLLAVCVLCFTLIITHQPKHSSHIRHHPFTPHQPKHSSLPFLLIDTKHRRRRERTMFEEIERRESRCRKREPAIDD
ncbi:hypothetical protein HanPI659440_Chr09g0319961 [Helianthus annuus]|nr:hypothetical protein HanPI659440_Chr09g0319961 [Helianthus annuus]